MTSITNLRNSGRTLHLIDIENELGTPSPTPLAVREAAADYAVASDWKPGDLTVIGSSRMCCSKAAFDWPLPHRWVTRDGRDGGDLALLAELACEPLFQIKRVVIASGDHMFAPAAYQLAARGITVEVVAMHGRLSSRLRLAAHRVTVVDHAPLGEAA